MDNFPIMSIVLGIGAFCALLKIFDDDKSDDFFDADEKANPPEPPDNEEEYDHIISHAMSELGRRSGEARRKKRDMKQCDCPCKR